MCGYMDDTKASLLATRPGVGTSGVFPGLKSKFREKIPNAINVASKIENVKVVKLKEVLRLLLEADRLGRRRAGLFEAALCKLERRSQLRRDN